MAALAERACFLPGRACSFDLREKLIVLVCGSHGKIVMRLLVVPLIKIVSMYFAKGNPRASATASIFFFSYSDGKRISIRLPG